MIRYKRNLHEEFINSLTPSCGCLPEVIKSDPRFILPNSYNFRLDYIICDHHNVWGVAELDYGANWFLASKRKARKIIKKLRKGDRSYETVSC